jgi:6-phosphogluconolactonase (cycloisomerase 2 family)
MPRYYAGTTITLSQAVRVSEVLTDASDITFMWKVGKYGTEATVTPTHDGTGLYSVSITPDRGGDLYYRWDTEGDLDTAAEGVINIAPTQFSI